MYKILRLSFVFIFVFVCSVFYWRTMIATAFQSNDNNIRYRIVAVGNLPESHDKSLVLRKGQTVSTALVFNIEINLDSNISFGMCIFQIIEEVYDDSGQILLLPRRPLIDCLYEVCKEQERIKLNISAMEMVDRNQYDSILFSIPPRYRTLEERQPYSRPFGRSDDVKKRIEKVEKYKKELLRTREQIFVSPTMSAELVFSIKSKDYKSEDGKITITESVSGDKSLFFGYTREGVFFRELSTPGDRTLVIKGEYEVDFVVRKDILFSSHFPGHWGW